MARVTIMEALKNLLGSKLNDEIDLEIDNDSDKDSASESADKKESTVNENKDEEKVNEDEVKKEKDTSDEKDENIEDNEQVEKIDEETGVEKMADNVMFEDGWFDEASGKIDLSKIKNEEALNAIKLLSDKYNAEKESRLISDSLNDELKNYSLAVSEDTFKKVLDTSGVKIDKDGNVVGIKEAIETLKTSEPGFFKDKAKESNPLNEGFNPVEKRSTDNVNSFSQAFKLMDEIN